MIDVAEIQSVRDQLGFPDNSTALRFMRWLGSLYNAGLIRAPSYNFRAVMGGKSHILSAHVIDPADGQLTHITFGCSHCGTPVQTGCFPPKGYGPEVEQVPQSLRLFSPVFLVCPDCQKKLGEPGTWTTEPEQKEEP